MVADPSLETAAAYDVVSVTDGGGADFAAQLRMPSAARLGRAMTVLVTYSNMGADDLASPLLTLSAPGECQWQLPGTDQWLTGTEFRFIALSATGPANVLRPGQSETIEVKVRPPFTPGSFTLSVSSLGVHAGDGSEAPVDWSQLLPPVEPGVSDPARDAAVAELQAIRGDTWAEYIDKLGKTAAALATWLRPR